MNTPDRSERVLASFFLSVESIIGLPLIALVVVALVQAIQTIPQPRALVVKYLGKFHSVMYGGLHALVPFINRVAARVNPCEQVTSFQPQSVITADNVVVSIDSVIYYQVTDPMYATYEIANFTQTIEQLTVTTLRNVVGSLDLEAALTGRDSIDTQLHGVPDEATGRWGIHVNRVKLKAIDPPPSIQHAMEQQLHAERDERVAILIAQGVRESQIFQAEGEKQSAILRAEGQAQTATTRTKSEAEAINTAFTSIHEGKPTPDPLSYQYLRTLPEIAKGDASKIWVVSTGLTAALDAITKGSKGSGEDQN